jgi:hypothetical protein
MTVFKQKKDGMLYIIHEQRKDGNVDYTAIPYHHPGKVLKGVNPEDFTINEKKGPSMNGFL